jgi:YHS domain-containing protein
MKHMVQDLMCGKTLDWQSTVVLTYESRLLYFCCLECREKFSKTPRRYLRRECKPGDCIDPSVKLLNISAFGSQWQKTSTSQIKEKSNGQI